VRIGSLPCPIHNLGSDMQDLPASGCICQMSPPIRSFHFGQLTEHDRAYQYTIARLRPVGNEYGHRFSQRTLMCLNATGSNCVGLSLRIASKWSQQRESRGAGLPVVPAGRPSTHRLGRSAKSSDRTTLNPLALLRIAGG
jgi:hypothetical protein